MTDTNRLQELAACLRAHAAYCQHEVAELTEAAAALDEPRQIKEAALSVPEIEKRAAIVAQPEPDPNSNESVEWDAAWSEGSNDRATLLDALRAKEAEKQQAMLSQLEADLEIHREVEDEIMAGFWFAACEATNFRANFEALSKHASSERERLKGELNDAARDRDTMAALNRTAEEERDEARADAEECRKDRDIAIKSLEARTMELAAAEDRLSQAERDKAALARGIRLTLPLIANPHLPPGHPAQVAHTAWHAEHGQLVTRALQGEGSAAAVPSEGEAEKAPRVRCRVECCTSTATHGPGGEAVVCWSHAGDWPEILAAHRDTKPCNCADKPVTISSVCDPCKDSLPPGLWQKFAASELPQRREAAQEIAEHLRQRRDTKPENMP